ncbi:uncharacterized protein TNCV_3781371 [Trichonephila clavipes]|nr:uncharacterized protein TNCV_3781371 [Trichonephila clavipes]
MIRWVLKLAEFNVEWEHHPGAQNVVANVLSRNPVKSIVGENIACAVITDLVLSSTKKLISEQRQDPELGHIYTYLEIPDDSPVNATVCGNWSPDFKLVDGLLFYAKYATTLGELRVYIPRSPRDLGPVAYALRTAVHETTGKTPAELFLTRKLITPFQKLVMVTDGAEFAVGNIEKIFKKARQNIRNKHERWAKYCNRRSTNDSRNRNWRDAEVLDRQNDRRDNYRSIYGNGPQRSQEFENKNRFDRDNHGFESRNRQYQFRNKGPSENFSRGDRRHGGHLNSSRVRVDQDDQSHNERNPSIRLSTLCISPVELPHVPILLNETLTKALWDTGAEK